MLPTLPGQGVVELAQVDISVVDSPRPDDTAARVIHVHPTPASRSGAFGGAD